MLGILGREDVLIHCLSDVINLMMVLSCVTFKIHKCDFEASYMYTYRHTPYKHTPHPQIITQTSTHLPRQVAHIYPTSLSRSYGLSRWPLRPLVGDRLHLQWSLLLHLLLGVLVLVWVLVDWLLHVLHLHLHWIPCHLSVTSRPSLLSVFPYEDLSTHELCVIQLCHRSLRLLWCAELNNTCGQSAVIVTLLDAVANSRG